MFETEEVSYAQRKRKILLVLGITQVVAMLATVLLGRFEAVSSLISIASTVGWAVGILMWVGVDSEERGTEVGGGLRIALIILGIFALSYYLIKTRGIADGLKGLGWAVLYFIIVVGTYFVLAMVILTAIAFAGAKM